MNWGAADMPDEGNTLWKTWAGEAVPQGALHPSLPQIPGILTHRCPDDRGGSPSIPTPRSPVPLPVLLNAVLPDADLPDAGSGFSARCL